MQDPDLSAQELVPEPPVSTVPSEVPVLGVLWALDVASLAHHCNTVFSRPQHTCSLGHQGSDTNHC